MIIEPLSDHKNLVREIAELHQAEWVHFDPDLTMDERKAVLTNAAGHEGIPSVFVAIENSEFCGSAALVAQDLESHPELSPWLSAVFVKERWRGRGIAKSLIKFCECEAQKAGVQKLYLSTEFASKLYDSLGWQTIERCLYKGVQVDVMCRELGS